MKEKTIILSTVIIGIIFAILLINITCNGEEVLRILLPLINPGVTS
jgi:hypothetical protein